MTETTGELSKIIARNNYYQDGSRRLIVCIAIAFLFNIISVIAIIYIYTHPPAPVYFPTSASGRITKLYPLDQPHPDDAVVLQWTNLAAIAAYSYNFVNYRSELEAASEFFTADGWTSFLKSLKDSNNLLAVVTKKLVVSGQATRTPEILQKGVIKGRYSWRIKIPMIVTYQSNSQYTTQNIDVILLVTRVPSLNSPQGIGIEQFVSSIVATPAEAEKGLK